MEEQLKLFHDNQKDFLKFLKSKYHLYHLSNVFFRDIHYGVMSYLDLNDIKYRYTQAEELTRRVVESLERQNIFKKVDHMTWVLTYTEFKKPPVKPAASAKAAAPAAKPVTPGSPPAAAKPAAPAAKPPVPSAAQAGSETSKS